MCHTGKQLLALLQQAIINGGGAASTAKRKISSEKSNAFYKTVTKKKLKQGSKQLQGRHKLLCESSKIPSTISTFSTDKETACVPISQDFPS